MTTVLQVNLCGLIMLGSIMLAYAEGTGFPVALSVPLALLSLFVTERWKLFRLQTRWANCLGLVAFGLGAWELSQGNIEARLLSLAHLLAYLTWILLFLENLWDFAGEDEEIFRQEVRTTYLHELGHYLGLEEIDLEERGLG